MASLRRSEAGAPSSRTWLGLGNVVRVRGRVRGRVRVRAVVRVTGQGKGKGKVKDKR